jgi:hypothetical protein
MNKLPDCPCNMTVLQYAVDHKTEWKGLKWNLDADPELQHFHPGANYSFRSDAMDTHSGMYAQQCCYGGPDNGLLTDGLGAGTPDMYSSSGGWVRALHCIVVCERDAHLPLPPSVHLIDHYLCDVASYDACCRSCKNCTTCWQTYMISTCGRVAARVPSLTSARYHR